MSREYLLSKSPDGLTAEERLFKAGQKLTKNGVAGVPLVVTGFIIAISGALLVGIDSDLIELASVFWVIGGLFLLHGQYLIWRYYHGLHCLERAELLHNTRMAYECHIKPTDTKEQDKKQAQQPVSKGKTVQQPVSQPNSPSSTTSAAKWVCSICGTENKTQYGQCKACGQHRGANATIIHNADTTIEPPKDAEMAKHAETPTEQGKFSALKNITDSLTKAVSPEATDTIVPPPQENWKCPKCGTSNAMKYGQCKCCGTYRT